MSPIRRHIYPAASVVVGRRMMGSLGDDGDDGSDYSDYSDAGGSQDSLDSAAVYDSPIGPLTTDEQQMYSNNPDFTLDQLDTVQSALADGSLSQAGYDQIMSGNVSSDNLQSYMDTDPGASGSSSSSSTGTSSKPTSTTSTGASGSSGGGSAGGGSKGGSGSSSSLTAAQLAQAIAAATKSAAPTISTSSTLSTASLTSWLNGSLVGGIPNWALAAGVVLLVMSGRGRR
jgi:hypothetical protein